MRAACAGQVLDLGFGYAKAHFAGQDRNHNHRNKTVSWNPREHFRQVQAVFQDPFSCFNQFFTIRSQLKSSFHLFKQKPSDAEMEERVDRALLNVNIKPKEIEGKYPFSIDEETKAVLGAQWYPHKSVGGAQIGSLST